MSDPTKVEIREAGGERHAATSGHSRYYCGRRVAAKDQRTDRAVTCRACIAALVKIVA